MSSKLSILYKVTALPGRGNELAAVWDEQFAQFEKEPTTELYILNRSLADSDVFWAYELFTSKEAFEEHKTTPVVQRTIGPHLALLADRESLQGTPVRSVGAISL